ncbi:MAG TPA: hypothetical protein VMB51_05180 [Solirubrobacteraceae bacterium]|nr:hypothetical protein [Solirubrobacteraceae bacterium]
MTARLDAPAIGYRVFKWAGSGPLRSAAVEVEWPITREPQRARCLHSSHPAPQERCTCGLYAYSEPPGIPEAPVGAVVIGYGDLIIHPDGWRAETVELVALVEAFLPDRRCEHEWHAPGPTLVCSRCGAVEQAAEISKNLAGLDLLAEQYGVRVLDRWEDAAALARELGAEPIPEILHAEAEAWLLGPENREPLFPEAGGAYGDVERRLREMVPWLRRHMICRIDIQTIGPPIYRSGSAIALAPTGMEVRVTAMHPELRAEVAILFYV